LFYSTQIPACLWLLARNRINGKFRERRDEILFIDARGLGDMVTRTHREFSDEEITQVADTYVSWKDKISSEKYADISGFCKSVTLEEIRNYGYVLTPGRYVGSPPEEDGDPFEDKMNRLTNELREQQEQGVKLNTAIVRKLTELGFWGEEQNVK